MTLEPVMANFSLLIEGPSCGQSHMMSLEGDAG